MLHVATIKSETPDAGGTTAVAHMFRAPMAFASGGDGAQAGLKVSIKHSTIGAFFHADLQPLRGGAANHSPSLGRG